MAQGRGQKHQQPSAVCVRWTSLWPGVESLARGSPNTTGVWLLSRMSLLTYATSTICAARLLSVVLVPGPGNINKRNSDYNRGESWTSLLSCWIMWLKFYPWIGFCQALKEKKSQTNSKKMVQFGTVLALLQRLFRGWPWWWSTRAQSRCRESWL